MAALIHCFAVHAPLQYERRLGPLKHEKKEPALWHWLLRRGGEPCAPWEPSRFWRWLEFL
jgi:hypothetical protein